jgi:hypothetical protein
VARAEVTASAVEAGTAEASCGAKDALRASKACWALCKRSAIASCVALHLTQVERTHTGRQAHVPREEWYPKWAKG